MSVKPTKAITSYKRPVKKESVYALALRAHDGKGNLVFIGAGSGDIRPGI